MKKLDLWLLAKECVLIGKYFANFQRRALPLPEYLIFWGLCIAHLIFLDIKIFLQRCKIVWGAIKIAFRKNLGFWPNKGGGGGLTEAQVIVKMFQNQICLGKLLEMWWNTQYINGGAISHQFMKFLEPPIPNYSLSQPKKMKFFMKNNMLRIA